MKHWEPCWPYWITIKDSAIIFGLIDTEPDDELRESIGITNILKHLRFKLEKNNNTCHVDYSIIHCNSVAL